MTQSEIIFSVQESLEGGYEARALGHSIFTQADSLEQLKVMVRDAVSCHFDGGWLACLGTVLIVHSRASVGRGGLCTC
jgi:hypothetical protein